MSSYDYGPNLPPHMKRNQQSDHRDEERSAKPYSPSSSGRFDEKRRRYGDSCRDRGRETGRRKRDEDRHDDRSRDKYSHNRKLHYSTKKYNHDHPEAKRYGNKRTDNQPSILRKTSKRSKSDRTYNTDTEESSDDHEMNQWTKHDKVLGKSGQTSSGSDDETHPSVPMLCSFSSSKSPVGVSQNCPKDLIGPALPSDLMKLEDSPILIEGVEESNSVKDCPKGLTQEDIAEKDLPMGPALPPHLKKVHESNALIGPAVPSHLQKIDEVSESSSPSSTYDAKQNEADSCHKSFPGPDFTNCSKSPPPILGPVLPPGFKPEDESSGSCDEDDIVGPLLPEEVIRSSKNFLVQRQLEKNASVLKEEMEGQGNDSGSSSKRREEWMLELPPEGTMDLGLGPRSFRMRGAPEKGADRSMWTDTPADKIRKEEEAKRRLELGKSSLSEISESAASRELSNRDKFMEDIVKKHSKKRSDKSLLESHQKKMKKEKKKKEESGVKQERRPFNRETDLKTNVFDDAQKKAIFQKAQFLDDRFSSGKSKFL